MTMYSWRIRFSMTDPVTGGGDSAHKIVRAPTAADAKVIFDSYPAPSDRYFRGPEHIECFEPEGPYGVWDNQRRDWARTRLGDVRTGDLAGAIEFVEALSGGQPTDRWVPRELREEM